MTDQFKFQNPNDESIPKERISKRRHLSFGIDLNLGL
jgi:hypothetical protein